MKRSERYGWIDVRKVGWDLVGIGGKGSIYKVIGLRGGEVE